METSDGIKPNGFYLTRDEDGSLEVIDVKKIYTSSFDLNEESIPIWRGTPSRITQDGECGSPLIAETSFGYAILGIHMMGSLVKPVSGAIRVSTEDLCLSELSANAPQISSQSACRELGDLSVKSVFRYIDEGSANVYGSFKGFRSEPKSRVQLTPLVKKLDKHGYKIKYGPPVMNGYVPWRTAALDMVNPVDTIDSAIVDKCVQSYLSKLKNLDVSELMVYDDFTAINGAQGVSYVDKINRNTSAGNPWKKSKKFFMESIPEEHGMQHPVKVSKEIMDRVNDIISTYESNNRWMPNFCAHLKDEAVSFKKIKAGKTRVFTGAPMDWTIVNRKYLLCITRIIQNNRFLFEAAPGTIAQSYEWSEMYEYITKFGEDRIVAGDYKAFDKRMSPVFILAAFDIIKALCKRSGNYDDDDLRVIDGLAIDTAFPLVDFNGDLVEFFGSNPSGHPLTVIINSLVNSLYMRYTYFNLNPDKEVESFNSNVSLMTYGDDNIMSISKDIDWYHHTSISQGFASWGITYTMADKEAASIPFINIRDASFLKRSWRYDEDIGAFLAPLEHDSIEKMLMVWVKSKTISTEEQVAEVMTAAINEYFFYGKDVFEEKLTLFKSVISELELDLWFEDKPLPDWNCLRKRFWDNSARVGCMPSF
jgi:hypothetical protein